MIELPDKAEKSTTPMQRDTIYPTISPKRTDSCFQNDFANILKRIQLNNVIVPIIQLVAEPKFSLPLPPPKEDAPTDRSENPIEVTTLADTIGVISFI